MRAPIASLAAATLLAGCNATVVQHLKEPLYIDPVREIGRASENGAVATQILGNPFAVEKAALDRAVTEAMHRQHPGPAVDYAPVSRVGKDVEHRVVFLINRIAENRHQPCRGGANREAPSTSGAVSVEAAFCIKHVTVSSARGHVDASSPDDPSFKALIGALLREVIRRPVSRGGDSLLNND